MRTIEYPEIRALGYQQTSFDNDNANHLIAKDFYERAMFFLDALGDIEFPNYADPVEITFQIVSPIDERSLGLDIFVTPILSTESNAFCIAIPVNVVSHLTTIFTTVELGPDKVEAGVTDTDIDDVVFRKIYLLTFASLSYAFFHEFAHIRRAHIPFLYPHKYQTRNRASKLALGQLSNPGNQNKSTETFRLHRGIEIDADLLAIQYLMEFVREENFSKFFSFESNEMNHPELFGASIYIVMQLLELWRQSINGVQFTKSGPHPHPDIRAIFVESLILMRAEQGLTEQVDFERKFVEGMKVYASKKDGFGANFLPEFRYLEENGIDAAMEEYDVLRSDLSILKEKLQHFRVS